MLTDAGPLIALMDSREEHHRVCVDAAHQIEGPLLTCWPALTEAMFILHNRAGWRAQHALWSAVLRGVIRVLDIPQELFPRMHALMDRYRRLPMSLADAAIVALAESHGFDTVFSTDRHFLIYRLRNKRPLIVLPELHP